MDDPFAEIERNCEYSSSQEERLRHRRFFGETGVDPEFSFSNESTQCEGIPVDSTGIIMCSVSENQSSQSEEFLTPQENLLISSQEQTINLAGTGADDHHEELKSRGDVSTYHVGTVDLGKDSDPGFSVEKSPADKGLSTGKDVLGLSRDSSSVRKRFSGEILGGTGVPASAPPVDNVAEISGDSDSALRKDFVFFKKIFKETVSMQSGGVGGEIPVGNEFADTGFKGNVTLEVAPLEATDKEPEYGVRRDKRVRSSEKGDSSKKISKDLKGCRELPASIREPMKNAAKHLVPDSSSSESQSLESLMDTIVKLCGEKNATADSRNVDILETVEQRGMTFPRPRWWSPEMF